MIVDPLLPDLLGASEMLMANAVSQLAAKTPGKEAAAMEAFAAALRQVHYILEYRLIKTVQAAK